MASVNATDPIGYFGLSNPEPKRELDMETFMLLLTVQLTTQNPLEPMNDRDFFAQMAQLGTVQGLEKLQDSVTGNQATAMIGKKVTAVRLSPGGSPTVTGIAKQLLMKNGTWVLGIQEEGGGIVEVPMEAVLKVEEAKP